jgi:hypothetical protein
MDGDNLEVQFSFTASDFFDRPEPQTEEEKKDKQEKKREYMQQDHSGEKKSHKMSQQPKPKPIRFRTQYTTTSARFGTSYATRGTATLVVSVRIVTKKYDATANKKNSTRTELW